MATVALSIAERKGFGTTGKPRSRARRITSGSMSPVMSTMGMVEGHHLARETWRAFLVTPQTVLRWHRELVRRKWSRGAGRRPGRPSLAEATRVVILRLARENPRWGY